MQLQCRICLNQDTHKVYQTKEMFIGFRDPFEYFQCSHCQCLQILSVPDNISKYYPENYYSHESIPTHELDILSTIAQNMKKNHNLVGLDFIKHVLLPANILASIPSICETPIDTHSHILDVGCGEGILLYILTQIGFKHSLGLDPFIHKTVCYNNGLNILKQSIFEINQTFDLIMFHHSFEHMDQPLKVLQKVKTSLNPEGQCILRIPICSSYAWEHYRENWVNLDPPRHFYLHSHKSLELLLEQSELEVIKTTYDSNDFQFWASEQYKQNIPLTSETSYFVNKETSYFSSADILQFKSKAIQLNREKKGDYLVLWLKAKN